MTTLPHSCADCLEILGASTSWSPKGLSRPGEEELYVCRGSFSEINLPGSEVDISSPCSARLKKAWSFTSILPHKSIARCLIKHSDLFVFSG